MRVGSEIILQQYVMGKSYSGGREYNDMNVKYDCYITTPTQEREKSVSTLNI